MWPPMLYPVLYTSTLLPLTSPNVALPLVSEVASYNGFPSGNYNYSVLSPADHNNHMDASGATNKSVDLDMNFNLNTTLDLDVVLDPTRISTISTSSARAALVPDYNYSLLPRSISTEYTNPPHTPLSSQEEFQERSVLTGSGAVFHHEMVANMRSSLSSHNPRVGEANDEYTPSNTAPKPAILDYIMAHEPNIGIYTSPIASPSLSWSHATYMITWLRSQLNIYYALAHYAPNPEDTSRRARRAEFISNQRRARHDARIPHDSERGHHAPRGHGVRGDTPRSLSTRACITYKGFLYFYACMHLATIAYIVFAHMCAQNVLLAFSLFITPKRADKSNIIFLATLQYTLAIPITVVIALTLAYIAWHVSPTLRTLPLWTLGFSCAALMHILFYSL